MSRGPDRSELSQRADQEFFARARKSSPQFPSIADALERRRQLGEAIAARSLFALFIGGLLYGLFVNNFGFVMALFGFVGFAITCFVAGNRQFIRNGGHDSDRSRPF